MRTDLARHRWSFLLLLAILGCATTPSLAPAPAPLAPTAVVAPDPAGTVDRLVALGKSDNRVGEHAEVLCAEIGPRLTGSQNLERAAEWCRDRFAGWGLDARLEPWGEVAVGFDRGPWSKPPGIPWVSTSNPCWLSITWEFPPWTTATIFARRPRMSV